ncbi:type I toxin-antitoxin system Fst family toxin [Lactobacillus sp. PV034]|nr:type I toxin-antitoxin system Fst family toxin [Lactobacillus sp. PV034]QNQ81099.1 type I toxin-antitoxin system Fst family toxin [Lactobacillus sp. PV034]
MIFRFVIAPIIVGIILKLFDYWLNHRSNKR